MLRQNPFNPCQLQQEEPLGSGQWITIFDLALCTPDIKQIAPISNSETKRCNLASLLVDITLPDGLESILTERDKGISNNNTVGVIAGIIAAFLPGGIVATSLLGISGAQGIKGIFDAIEPPLIRSEANNAYWLAVKQQIFCTLPDNCVLTPEVLESLAFSLYNIPNKQKANDLLARIIRGLSSESSQYAPIFGDLYEGDSNGCSECIPVCQLIAENNSPQPISLGNNRWRSTVNSPLYYTYYRLPYNNHSCRIMINTIYTAP